MKANIVARRPGDPAVRRPIIAFLGCAITAMLTVPASPQEDVEVGSRIAEERCSRCHAVGTAGDSPLAEAPPFRTFASKWPVESLEEALAEGIMVGHVMPEFVFTPDEIGAFIAYLRSLRDPEAGR